MADLGPQTPASTYQYLLQVASGLTGSYARVDAGNGTASPLYMSTTGVKVAGTLLAQDGVSMRGDSDSHAQVWKADPAYSSSHTYYLPNSPPVTGQVLGMSSYSGGNYCLSWQNPSSGSGGAATQMSITSDASGIKLVGDEASPAGVSLYASDLSNDRGWHTPLSLSIAVWASVPASAGAAGSAGMIASDGLYFYMCYATNSWGRIQFDAWAGGA